MTGNTNIVHNVNKHLLMLYANVDNSLISKYEELCVLVNINKYDIIALNEVKPKNGVTPDLSMLALDGYTLYTSNFEEPCTRGVCIYVNNRLESTVVTLPGDTYKDAVWVKTFDRKHKDTTLVGCIYRSGTPATARRFDQQLNTTLTQASELDNCNKIIVGDFNMNRIKWEPEPIIPEGVADDAPERVFVECVRDLYLYQHVTNPTRYRLNQTPTLDDLVLTSEEGAISDLKYEAGIGASDHISLTFKIMMATQQNDTKRTLYCFNKGDYNKLNEMLDINWENVLENKSPQEAMNLMEDKITEAVKACIPTKTLTSSHPKRKPVWMNAAALRRVRKKHSSWIRYLNTMDGQNYLTYIYTST
jgi:hypothetical protein